MNRLNVRSCVLGGALDGLIAWLSYGAISFIIFPIGELTINPENMLGSMFWESFAIIFTAYILVGLALGAISGALTSLFWKGEYVRARTRLMAIASLLSVFLANLWWSTSVDVASMISSVVGLMLISLCVRGMISPVTQGAYWYLTSPLTAVLLVLLPLWVRYGYNPSQSVTFWVSVSIGGLIAAALLSFFIHRLPLLREFHRSTYLTIVVSLLVASAGAGVAMNAEQPAWPARQLDAREDMPNIVFVVMDTARADNLSMYGYERPTTPNLKAFAEGATLYRNAVTVVDYTLPAHSSMFTGLYPRSHRAHDVALRDSFDTMAEILYQEGYRTAAVAATFFVFSVQTISWIRGSKSTTGGFRCLSISIYSRDLRSPPCSGNS